MKLTILGSGTMMPTRDRHPSALLLEEGYERILIDCGHCTIARLVERGVDLHSIGLVGVSHFHPDHSSDLLPLLYARRVDSEVKGKRDGLLEILAPHGSEYRLKKLHEAFWSELPDEQSHPLFLHYGRNHCMGKMQIQPFEVVHAPQRFHSIGFRITSDEKTFVYTGDMSSHQHEGFEKAIKDADVLLIEAGSDKKCSTHLTPQEAFEFGIRSGAKKIILTHISEERVPRVREFVNQYPNLLVLAEDNMEIEI